MGALAEVAQPGDTVAGAQQIADLPQPPAPPAETVAASVQDAIDAHVASYRALVETKIKAGLADAQMAAGVVFHEIGGDFANVIRGRPMQIQDKAGTEHNIPRWAILSGLALSIVGVVAILHAAGHALNLF